MANQSSQKLKLLHLWRILLEKTDDDNGVTTQEIIEELAYYGIDAERKGIYRDMNALRDFGYSIELRGGKKWYLATRPMDLQEMVMLVDAVQSSPFLTEEMTDHLIDRIRQLASIEQREMLQKRIEVPGRIKMQNESVLENLDAIQQAMRCKRKIEFTYFHYDINKKRVLNKGGYIYQVTPVRLIYADEFYYLISFMDKWADVEGHQPFTPYRVDRMMNVRMCDEPATKDPRIANYVTEDHISPSFGVFATEKVPITLEFDQSAMNTIIDKFGLDALVFEKSDDRARAYVKAPLSPQFYGWLLQLGPLVKILHPQRAIDEFARMLDQTRRMYRGQYRILSERSPALNQEQFLRLVETLETALVAETSKLPQGGFVSEESFIDFAWDIIEKWMAEQNVDDGMPKSLPEKHMIRGKLRSVPAPVHSITYVAFGQAAGEAILAVEPRKWAAPKAKKSFLNTAARYSGRHKEPFRFEPLTDFELCDPPQGESGSKRKRAERNGAAYEIWHERGEKAWRCRFTSDKVGMGSVDIDPWLGGEMLTDARKGAFKHWQKVAYMFS